MIGGSETNSSQLSSTHLLPGYCISTDIDGSKLGPVEALYPGREHGEQLGFVTLWEKDLLTVLAMSTRKTGGIHEVTSEKRARTFLCL